MQTNKEKPHNDIKDQKINEKESPSRTESQMKRKLDLELKNKIAKSQNITIENQINQNSRISFKDNQVIYQDEKSFVDENVNRNKKFPIDKEKRDFLITTTTVFGIIAVDLAAIPLLQTFAPAQDAILESTIEVDLSHIKVGSSTTVKWRGKPVFIRHRTPEEIMEAMNVDVSKLKDPESDDARINKSYPQWLIVIGICTHLGCIPKNQDNGWFCPCHGSSYDASGRIISGPAPKNLDIPKYEFIDKYKIRIG